MIDWPPMRNTHHPIQCQCGRLRGSLARDASVTRLSCYCRDCQTYARALPHPERILDPMGGTDVVATLQQHVSITEGKDQLACLSLSDKGLLRWYASCCNTPIGNTARDPKLSYIGLVHTCLEGTGTAAALDTVFGPSRMPVNTQHAKGKVKSNPLSAFVSTMRLIGMVLKARMNGSWKRSEFFAPGESGPVVQPRVLSREERDRAWARAH
jgi:hypothetical protein